MVIAHTYQHFADVPPEAWRWDDFAPEEVACRHCGELIIHFESMDCLQALRTRLGKPLILNSAYRCLDWNHLCSGSPRSKHLLGKAFDLDLAGHDRDELVAAALAVGFRGIGKYDTFLHIDVRPTPATWTG